MNRNVIFKFTAILGVLLFGLIISLKACGFSKPTSEKGASFTSRGPTIEQIQKLSQLVMLKISVADILEGEGFGYRGSWLIKGDGVIGVDLEKARFISTDEKLKKLIIELPKPRVLTCRVDHSRTKTYDMQKTTWIPFSGYPDKLRDQAMQNAQELVENSVQSDQYIHDAQLRTEIVIRSLFGETGWSTEFSWNDAATTPSASNKSK